MINNIGAATYQNNANLLTNDSNLVEQATPLQNAGSQNSDSSSAISASGGDQVTLSPAVDEARLRESLGWPPTGKVTRQDVTAQIQTDQAGVLQTLQGDLEELGLASDTAVTLSQDANGQIQVTGAGASNTALAKTLNADADFTAMFSRLAANSKFLNFSGQAPATAGTTATLFDYLDGNTADSNLTTLLQQYSALKNSNNSLSSLISLSSNSGNPFTFTNSSNQDQAQAAGSTSTLSDYLNGDSNTADSTLASLLASDNNPQQAQAAGSTPTLSDYLNGDGDTADSTLASLLAPDSTLP